MQIHTNNFFAALSILCCLAVLNGSTIGCDGSNVRISTDHTPKYQTVQTTSGPIRGVANSTSTAFLGIPYAMPPVGDLRWAPPQPAASWDKEILATDFGPSCPQFDRKVISEDCLTLNVWTPNTNPETSAPVMVWIHGGSMSNGETRTPFTSGLSIAEHEGLVVVSINYRLGAFGFLTHSALGERSGNYGILDQRAALRWVRDNIATFGGDPDNITLTGESAGSASVCVQMTAPGSEGLFHQAIMQSGPCGSIGPDGMTPIVTRAEAEAQGEQFIQAVDCDQEPDIIDCLREKNVDEVLSALPLVLGTIVKGSGVNWFPHIDDELILGQPAELIEQGNFHRVPLLIGSTADEGTVFAAGAGLMFISRAQYIQRVQERFGDLADAVLQKYPPFAWGAPYFSISKLLGDMVFVCPARRTVRAISNEGLPAFLYSFDVIPSYSGVMTILGAYHASEIPFVFNSIAWPFEFSDTEAALSLQMMKYWTTFAKNGDPNFTNSPLWPAYDTEGDEHIEFTTHSTHRSSGLEKEMCDFWDSVWP
jgi:para-nitrobenzyl esterase